MILRLSIARRGCHHQMYYLVDSDPPLRLRLPRLGSDSWLEGWGLLPDAVRTPIEVLARLAGFSLGGPYLIRVAHLRDRHARWSEVSCR